MKNNITFKTPIIDYEEVYLCDWIRYMLTMRVAGIIVWNALIHVDWWFAWVLELDVNNTFQWKWYWTYLLKVINNFIKNKSLEWRLIDVIGIEEPAFWMYERHGWVVLEDEKDYDGKVLRYNHQA
jgi:GNAT superfamily N-acetyltransferase